MNDLTRQTFDAAIAVVRVAIEQGHIGRDRMCEICVAVAEYKKAVVLERVYTADPKNRGTMMGLATLQSAAQKRPMIDDEVLPLALDALSES